jgi:error-prone DNA polymerase
VSGWVPLWVESNYSFLTGASDPAELVTAAVAAGLSGIALTDRDSLAGVVQARGEVARQAPVDAFTFIVGARVTVGGDAGGGRPIASSASSASSSVLLLALDRTGYGNLSQLISVGRLRSPKGFSLVSVQEIAERAAGLALVVTEDSGDPDALIPAFPDRAWIGIARHYRPEEQLSERWLRTLADTWSLPIVATPRVLYHETGRRRLQDALTCIHHGVRIDTAGAVLQPNGSFGIVSAEMIARRYRDHPEWITETAELARRVRFDLRQIEYRYPGVRGVDSDDEGALLRRWVTAGAGRRYPDGVPPVVSRQLETELTLIEELNYDGYFLTMAEIVGFCRSRGILCQGRGSAANSVVCFCLGITAVDPVKMQLLFERFISRERAEPPDIDLDIEHRRREEVIQYVYERYGRDHAAMVANTIRFRTRLAVRELGKVFGFSEVNLDQLAKQLGHQGAPLPDALAAGGFDTDRYRVARFVELVGEIIDTPRHLSIHPGGFLLGQDPIARIVPVENGAMAGRTVIQWDKYAVEEMNLFKLDLLGLGALTHLDYAFRLMAEHLGIDMEMALIPQNCQTTFAMLQRGDTVGVFQLESRAQMAMLPRMIPKRFYDLVIEISIVRPGPITGGMVHPYLRRRHGEEPIHYPHPDLEPILARTLGVPLFQEQVMKLAVVAADYTPGEADQLRRDMAAWRRHGRLEAHQERIVERMVSNGIERQFAEQVFEQIRGFGEYGFPESHAASFALIAYATAWMRAHYPVIFTCALLNAWPMGFYSPSTIVHDAIRAGVTVRPVDIRYSRWECTLEPIHPEPGEGPNGSDGPASSTADGDGHLAIRIGFRFVKGLSAEDGERIIRRRIDGGDIATLRLDRDRALRLAEAGAFDGLGVDRRSAVWQALGEHVVAERGEFSAELFEVREKTPRFSHLEAFEKLSWDYRAAGHSTAAHPLEPHREWLTRRAYPTAAEVAGAKHNERVSFIGMVINRQRPSTAGGTVFITLEDETGFVNLIVWKSRYEELRPVLLTTPIIAVRGVIQKSHGVVHLIVEAVWPAELPWPVTAVESRDFH